jgi:hypothetical protein
MANSKPINPKLLNNLDITVPYAKEDGKVAFAVLNKIVAIMTPFAPRLQPPP